MDDRSKKLAIGAGAVLLIVLLIVVLQWWKKPPVVAFDNLKYIQLLRTAVSSRSDDYLNRVQATVQKRREASQITGTEFHHFENIIRLARQGSWDQADRMAFDFEAAQLSRSR